MAKKRSQDSKEPVQKSTEPSEKTPPKPPAAPQKRPAPPAAAKPPAPAAKPKALPVATKPKPPAAAAKPKPAPKPAPRRVARSTAPSTKHQAPAPSTAHQAPSTARNALDVLVVASEARPFAKTGGLADVAGALPEALAHLGHRVTLVVPRYRGADTSGMTERPMDVPFGANRYPVTVLERELPSGVRAVLLDAPDLFDRDGLYGDGRGDYKDNAFRFAVLCRGALEFARVTGRRPSVIHAHDWQGGLAAVYARTELADDPVIGGVRTVFTIHNLAFQGLFDPAELQWINLDRGLYHPGALEYWGQASSLKGGVVFSDVITTVSPTYAREILGPQFGFNFQGILQDRASRLVGILNGIDTKVWNPATDPHLPRPYDAADLSGKRDAKRALLEAVNMPADNGALDRAVVGLVSRLTYQKGFDLVLDAGDRLLGAPVTYVMLGSGDRHYEDFWTSLAVRFPDRVATRIGFDDRLAHLIEAGADMFLMPSWFEPCGLNQMYSLRYGTLPIVRATGGLEDTVRDADADQAGGNGFKFYEFTADAMLDAIHRAAWGFGERERWAAIQRRGMAEDHSWDVSAREYVKVFEG